MSLGRGELSIFKENIIEMLKKEVNKWKNEVVAYIDDYKNIYCNDKNISDNETVVIEEEKNDVQDESKNIEIVNNTKDETKPHNRNEYMKEYMRDKRKKQKEEKIKQLNVNKNN